MRRMTAALAVALCLAATPALAACENQPAGREGLSGEPAPTGKTVFEDTVSPNEAYVSSQDDVVYYTVRVTQDASGTATVSGESNSGFFEPVSYEVECGGSLSADDVSVTWTTLMGSPEATEEDQIAVAVVSVRRADGSADERKVSFVNGAIEMVAEAVPAA